MTWKTEAKYEKQKYYGYYCYLAKENNIIPIPYHEFTIEIFKELKKNYDKTI